MITVRTISGTIQYFVYKEVASRFRKQKTAMTTVCKLTATGNSIEYRLPNNGGGPMGLRKEHAAIDLENPLGRQQNWHEGRLSDREIGM